MEEKNLGRLGWKSGIWDGKQGRREIETKMAGIKRRIGGEEEEGRGGRGGRRRRKRVKREGEEQNRIGIIR